MLNFAVKDYVEAIAKLCMNPEFETEKKKFYDETAKGFFDHMTTVFGNKNFLTGNNVCYADF